MVDLAKAQAKVLVNTYPSIQLKRTLVQVVEDAGFDCSLKSQATDQRTVTVNVSGMTCQSCVKTITAQVQALNGIITCQVSLERNSAIVSYTPSFVSEADILRTIEDCGFDVSLAKDSGFTALDSLKTLDRNQNGSSDSFLLTMPPLMTPTSAVYPESLELLPLPSSKPSTDSARSVGRSVTLEVRGMTCGSCVGSIESHLRQVPGIHSISVSLLAQRAEVHFNDAILQPNKIAELITDMGFDATVLELDAVKVVNLKIYGMTCASCSGTIEREVRKVPGVISVSVNLLGQSGRFEYDKKLSGIRAIISKVEDLGFDALLEEETNASAQLESLERSQEIRKWRQAFYNSTILAVPVSCLSMIVPMFAPHFISQEVFVPGLQLGDLLNLILTFPIQFWIGSIFYKAAFKSLKHGTYTMVCN
jgi:Cu+-exporting ATPase